ncbi:T9SS type A sorting domain-containing protein [bacterium]|nr:T9SS type A sorting domain-containing protein [bacterium]
MRKRALFVSVAVLFLLSAVVWAAPLQKVSHNPYTGTVSLDPQENARHELDEVYWTEDWENGENGWYVEDSAISTDYYWATSDYEPQEGDNSWRCFDPDIGTNGGYDNHWLQWIYTPELDLTGTTSPEATFQMRIICEDPGDEPAPYDGWDGGNVWVMYTDGGETVREVVETDVAYNVTASYAFGFEWGYGEQNLIPQWSGTTDFADWQMVTLDLSDYTDYDDVQVAWVFCSDPAYSTYENDIMTGYQIDDIQIVDGADELFADDAEDPENSELDFHSGRWTSPAPPPSWEIIEEGGTAPSPTHVLAQEDTRLGFTHYWVSPDIDLTDVELMPGQQLKLDVMVRGDLDNTVDEANWTVKVWRPDEEVWAYASNVIQDPDGNNYVYIDTPDEWSSFDETYSDPWLLNPVAGMVTRIRVEWTASTEPYVAFTGAYFDDFTISVPSIEYDLQTKFYVEFPTSVGIPNEGWARFVNNGTEPADNVTALWFRDTIARSFNTGSQITVPALDSIEVYIDDMTTEPYGWTPTEDEVGEMTVSAEHRLDGDQIPDNDRVDIPVDVTEEGVWELGHDLREIISGSINIPIGSGQLMYLERIEPIADEPVTVNSMDYGYLYLASDWPATDPEVTVHVYEANGPDGDVGDELYSGTFTVPGQGSDGYYVVNFDFSDDAPTGVTSDFYVWVEMMTESGDPNRGTAPYTGLTSETNEILPQTHYWIWDGDQTFNNTNFMFYMRLNTVSENSVEELTDGGVVPNDFALGNAYPNPFNPSTTINFDVARLSNVKIAAYNVMGQEVATVLNRSMDAGSYNVTWNAADLASGVYFVRMEADGFNAVRKVMLMK